MAHSSELGYYERFDPSRVDTDRPASAGLLRRLVGNANHIADQYAQRRVVWLPISGVYYEPEVAVVANTVQRLWSSTPFDLHVVEKVDPAGVSSGLRSYGLRIRLHAACSASGGLAIFRVVVAATGRGMQYVTAPPSESAPNRATFGVSSTSHTWYAAEYGPASPQVAFLNDAQIAQARVAESVRDAPGGRSSAALWMRCSAEVWASASSGVTPRVSGLIVDEYYGP